MERGGACGKEWARACGRGKVPWGQSPGEGLGGGCTLSTRPSGLSSVARAMVFTCNV